MNLMVNRCMVFVPVNNPHFVEQAWTWGADVIILDLEDTVPMSEKEKARNLVRGVIPKVAKGGASVFVRINKEFIESDLRAAVWPGISRIIFPKTESAKEIQLIDTLLTELEKERGIPLGTIEISPALETALGVVNSYSIATSSPRIKKVMGGIGYDLSADLEIEMFANFEQYAYTRAEPALAGMVAGVEATGAPYVPGTGRVDQSEQGKARAQALRNAHIYEAVALHPEQIEPLVIGLTPTPTEVNWAKKVIDVYEKLEQDGESMSQVGEQVVDIYEYRYAQELLQWGDACAAKDQYKMRAVAKARSEH